VITAIDGTTINDSRELARKVGMMAPGSRIKLTVAHKGEVKTLDLTLAKMPDQKQAKKAEAEKDASTGGPRLGLNLAPAKDVGGASSEGVAVVGVDPNGPASERGIKTGDVILDVGGKVVTNVADVRKALSDARSAGKSSILLRVKTAEAMRFVALPIGKA
jgi:serine protease Do